MSIDKFYEKRYEGVEYNVQQGGTTNVTSGQLKIDNSESVAE
ncbi:hypothetical protein [Bacillus thuringiensis]